MLWPNEQLVVSVIVCVPIILALRAAGIFGSDPDPLVVLLALIEPAMPSSQTLVVLLNMEGLTDAASRLGAAYVIQVRKLTSEAARACVGHGGVCARDSCCVCLWRSTA